ncbi:MAG: molybdopterin-dependent oxidoreductase, partial [Nevskiales bacterium]
MATAAQASATAQNPLFVITAMATGLDALAEAVERCDPDSAARLGQAVAHRLGIKQSKVKGLSRSQQQLTKQIAEQLMQSERPVIISGTNSGDGGVIEAAANIAWALKSKGKQAKLAYALPEVNSLGAAMLGGGGLQEALGRMGGGAVDAVIVLENDLYQRATAEAVDYALDHTSRLIVLDHQTTATTERAIAVVPAAGLGEGDGSLVNYESRVQRSFQVFDPQYFDPESGIAESWRWLQRMAGSDHWQGLDDITQACAQAVPALAEIVDAAPLSDARFAAQRMPRMTHRASGRTAMRAGLSVQEPRPVIDLDTALNFSMEGYNGAGRPAALTAYAWAPGWNSPQAWNKFQEEVAGALKGGDPGIRLLKGEEE